MSAYWLGVLTTPAVVLWVLLVGFLTSRALDALDARGFNLQPRWRRDVDGISDYTLRRDIWWERTFGPIIVGGWYRERGTHRFASRWVGLGRATGPNVLAFHVRDLGEEADDARD